MAKRSRNNGKDKWTSIGPYEFPAAYHNGRISVGSDQVQMVQDYLECEWGISLPHTPYLVDIDWSGIPDHIQDAFHRVQDIRRECLEADYPIPTEVEHEFYELISEEKLLGQVHSIKRTVILDEACAALAIARCLPGGSRILEVGSHAGYIGMLLARVTGCSVVSEDFSPKAIDLAQRHGNGLPSFEARVRDYTTWREGGEMFDMVIACDAATRSGNSKLFDYCMKQARAGGILFLVGAFCGSVTDRVAVRKSLSATGFKLLDADVVGGLNSSGPAGAFDAVPLLLMQNGCPGPDTLPANFCDQTSRHWPGFRDYANDPNVEASKKTQAWYNALVSNQSS
jgi:protein-L-isoaspartate O-methyltransferase